MLDLMTVGVPLSEEPEDASSKTRKSKTQKAKSKKSKPTEKDASTKSNTQASNGISEDTEEIQCPSTLENNGSLISTIDPHMSNDKDDISGPKVGATAAGEFRFCSY